jgi:hypothetical protein
MTVPLTDEELGEMRRVSLLTAETFKWTRLLDEHAALKQEIIHSPSYSELAGRCEIAEATAARRLELLRALEWPNDDQGGWCHICDRPEERGHAPDCKLAKELNP